MHGCRTHLGELREALVAEVGQAHAVKQRMDGGLAQLVAADVGQDEDEDLGRRAVVAVAGVLAAVAAAEQDRQVQ